MSMENLKELKSLAEDLTVLYVEDDVDIAKTLVNYLSKLFKEVIYAKNGQEGLDLYKDNPCDLVITDIKMPQMHGLDMTYEIKQIKPDQNVIIISAYSEVENFLSSIKLGVDGYIIKPVDYTDMNRLLFKMVNRIKTDKYNEIYLNRVNNLIEELNISNAELQHYTDALNKVALVVKTNLEGKITFVNDFFCDITGYTKEELIGTNYDIIRHPDISKSIFQAMWQTIENKKIWEGTLKNKTKKGDPFYVHASVIPLLNWDEESIKEIIGICFLTTSDEQVKREFKKKVMLSYQEFRKETYQYKQRIKELEDELLQLKGEDKLLKTSSNENKSKHAQLLSQIKFYEKEIQKTNENHTKILEFTNENNKKITESYKKALQQIDMQKKKLEHFVEENQTQSKEIIKLEEQVKEQRHVINELRQTLKDLREQKEPKDKEGLFKKLL